MNAELIKALRYCGQEQDVIVSAVHIGTHIDGLRHEIWELRKDIQERGEQE